VQLPQRHDRRRRGRNSKPPRIACQPRLGAKGGHAFVSVNSGRSHARQPESPVVRYTFHALQSDEGRHGPPRGLHESRFTRSLPRACTTTPRPAARRSRPRAHRRLRKCAGNPSRGRSRSGRGRRQKISSAHTTLPDTAQNFSKTDSARPCPAWTTKPRPNPVAHLVTYGAAERWLSSGGVSPPIFWARPAVVFSRTCAL